MNKFHSFATSRTDMFTVDVLAPIANISTAIVVETRFAFEHFVFAAVAEMVGRTVVRVRVELGLLIGTLDGAVDDGGLGRHEHGSLRAVLVVHNHCGHFSSGWRRRANRLCWPHARFVWLRVPQTVAALEYCVKAW